MASDLIQKPLPLRNRERLEANYQEFYLCHSIEVCARRPPWVANGMCSSVLSESNCSRSAANINQATASPACEKPSRKLSGMRSGECGVRNKLLRAQAAFSSFRTPHSPLRTGMVRLQKFLADAGVASRRAGEQLVMGG